jgi:hypothetical protein
MISPAQYSGLAVLPTGGEVYLEKTGENADYLDAAADSGFLTKRP